MSKILYEGPDSALANMPDEDFKSRIVEIIEDAVTSAVEDAITNAVGDAITDAVEDAITRAVEDSVEDSVRETMEEIIDNIVSGEKYLKQIYILSQDKRFICPIKRVELVEGKNVNYNGFNCEAKENSQYAIVGLMGSYHYCVLGRYVDEESAKTEMENIFLTFARAQNGGNATYDLK